MAHAGLRCPNCANPLEPGDFLCVKCETIADPSLWLEDEQPREPTVVRAMLAPPEPTLSHEPPPRPEPQAPRTGRRSVTKTRLFTLPADPEDLPSVAMGLDLKAHRLSSFEAYFISLVDGRSSVEQLRQIAGLSIIETQSLLRTLIDRQILSVAPPPKPAPRKRREAEEPPPPRPPAAAVQPPARAASPHRRASSEAAAPAPAPAPPARKPQPPAAHLLQAAQLRQAAQRRREAPAPRDAAPVSFSNPLQRAIALERAGDAAGAIKILEHAIAHSREPAPLYNRLAIALVKERRDVDTAEELLRKALDLDPHNEVYRQNLFKVLSMAAAVTGLHKRPTKR
jgi:hypothetical protein